MIVLIDTNILISALLKDGLPEAVILWILEQPEWQWLASPAIMQEYQEVMLRKKLGISPALVRRWLELLDDAIVLCEPDREIDFPRDRKDAKFLACAQFFKADILITGDRDFNDAQNLIHARILSPAGFANLFMMSA
jgi:putative PIN family toxin of toxin-antitoxin system